MTSPPGARRRRVPALAPEDRRAALIAATVPLLHEHGLDVSTKQIAQAAGVAEGTIFGVFKDKGTLIAAALAEALDPQPTLDELAGIDPGAGLRERLAAAADLINERFSTSSHLMSEARKLAMSPDAPSEAFRRLTAGREELLRVLTALVEPSAAELRRSPAEAARLFLLFCMANTVAPAGDTDGYGGPEIASLLLDGLLIVPTGDAPVVVPLLAHRNPEVP